MPNRLARERSPYLLQHANNPVDWYAWGPEAFARARAEDKPIFLSIGYSTCHWCHVMERESFEDPAIAAVLNEHFVSIKLDREERPDVDRVYMMFVQATTGAGGWPLSVWLTPDLKPFFGGTYFPPETKWGRPGFVDVLQQLARAWQTERLDVVTSAQNVLERLRQATGADDAAPDSAPVADRAALDAGIASFAQSFDARHGGFGGAPKFPRPSELLFLLRAGAFTGDRRAWTMAFETLRGMAFGGIRDHIGGGFHRYSVDAEWRVPHFEKMLYDQAQLVLAYLDAAQASGDAFYASVAEDTLDYVARDLTSPDGAFYSAEDADSLSTHGATASPPASGIILTDSTSSAPPVEEKREGAFYVWTSGELVRLLGSEDADLISRRFGVEPQGNALADPQGEFEGQNILYIAQSIEDVAVRSGVAPERVMAALTRARGVLFEARAQRPRPHLDDKVLTAWNGLMIAAFARAARTLVDSARRDEWRDRAERAAAWVREHLWRPSERRLLRRYRDGEAAVEAFAEDYAYLVWGLIELFQATGRAEWLEWAIELTTAETELFFDARDGGWFSTTGEDASVLLRMKEDYDGAEPSAQSVTVQNLITLGHLTTDASYVDRARRALERYGPEIARVVRVMPLMVSNLVLWHSPATQVVLVGAGRSQDLTPLEQVVAQYYLPASLVVLMTTAEDQPSLARRLPWLAAMAAQGGHAAAFVCHDFTCRAPVSDPAALELQLREIAEPHRIV
jgi:uncharacterized protein YyaL (SSP411 family)